MDSLQKIGKFEAISLIVMITINQIIFNLPNTIIISTGSSAWLNVIFISIVAILFCLLVCKLFKIFPTQDIVDVSSYLGGKVLKVIVGILYMLFFIFIAGILLRYLSTSLQLIYFEKNSIVFLLLLFLIPVVFAVKLGVKPISQVNLIITPIVFFSILIILFAIAKYFVPENLFPILGFGADKTFLIGLNNIFTFSCFAYLYFLIPILKNPEDFKKIAVTSIIVSAIYLFLSVVCLLMIFPFIPFSDEMLSVYLLTRIIEFGKFFQRIDAIFIFVWILSTFSFLSITTELINRIFKKLTRIKDDKEMTYSVCAIIFSVALLFKNIADMKYIQNVVLKYVVILLVFVMSLAILILANFKHKKEKSQ